jgi:DnaD/phage-associated family protein
LKHVIKDARYGFYIIQNDVLDDYGAKIGPLGIAVYNALCRYASRDGTAFPSLQTISDLIGMSRPSVVKYLKVLKDCGLIAIDARTTDAGDSDSNIYTITNYSRGGGVVNDVNHLVNDVNHRSKPALPGVVNDVNTNNTYMNNTQLPIPPQKPVSSDDGDAAKKKERGAVHKCWQENMPGMMTGVIAEQIDELIADYGSASLIHAITVAFNANVRNMRYVKGVLQRESTAAPPGNHVNGNHKSKSVSVQRVEGEEW